MRILSRSHLKGQSGFSLLIVMVFVGVSLVVFGSMMFWVSTNAKITLRNNLFNQAEAASESADEYALAPMIRDYVYQSLNAGNNYYTNVPAQAGWPGDYRFTFSDLNGTNGQISVNIGQAPTTLTPLGSQFANLKAYQQYATNTAIATTTTNAPYNVSATVQEIISFASIPVFQYAIFYNLDLEVNPGNQMTINGPVHSNNNIYTTGNSAANNLVYSSIVEAAQQVNLNRSTNDPNASGSGQYVSFSDTTNNPLNNADSLSMPIGTNNNPAVVEGILNLPPAGLIPPSAAAYSPTGMVYLYNAVDLIVSNSPANNTNFVFYENPNAASQIATVAPDSTNIVATITTNVVHGVTTYSTTYATNTYYSYVTNATFYDYRESDTVQAIQIDVAKLNTWLTNNTATGGAQYNTQNSSGTTSKGHTISSIYAYNSVPLTATTLPAVRLVNGQQLPPAGLTVATPQPLYVEGNYNIQTNSSGTQALTLGSTTNGVTVPAALMGDAVTILSPNWSDAYNSGTALTSRTPVNTTINAATLEGIVQSATINGTKNYSGGVENFLRLLENWSGSTTLTYNGSIVVMFPSQYATNFWNGNIYGVPRRQWGFDTTFSQSGKLPPLTPQAKKIVRLSWSFY
jgi:hypothetical protein